MNVLACRSTNVESDGTMAIDGQDYSLSELKQVAGYVMQDDLLNGRLTVEETLYYTAELRLPSSMSAMEKKQRIEDVMSKLGLSHVRGVIIGDNLKKGISGGERKRVCVAMELLTRPRLLFLDEPTSGLDSVTALSLCTLLRDLAHSGQCTVVTTIHQPQTKIFQMFDDLILLKSTP
jgi:ATP-binding cassette subfamily G (WHITE) protein 2